MFSYTFWPLFYCSVKLFYFFTTSVKRVVNPVRDHILRNFGSNVDYKAQLTDIFHSYLRLKNSTVWKILSAVDCVISLTLLHLSQFRDNTDALEKLLHTKTRCFLLFAQADDIFMIFWEGVEHKLRKLETLLKNSDMSVNIRLAQSVSRAVLYESTKVYHQQNTYLIGTAKMNGYQIL